MIVINQHQVTLAIARINGNPEEAARLRDAAQTPEERTLWTFALRQIQNPQPKRSGHG